MPELIKEMQEKLTKPENDLIREFFILPNNRVAFNAGGKKYLFYFEEEHHNLLHKIKLLQDHGFVEDITHIKAPKYRMSEGYVGLILKIKI